MINLYYIVSHPIYYQINLLNYLNSFDFINLHVYFYNNFDLKKNNFDKEFNKSVNFTLTNDLNFKFDFINKKFNFYKLIFKIFKKENSFFWFHGWNKVQIIFYILLIKSFTKKKILIRAENFYNDNLFSNNFKKILFKAFDYFLYIGEANYNYYNTYYSVNKSKLIPLKYSSGIHNSQLISNFIRNKTNKGRVKLIYVGKLIHRKNVIFLVQSLLRFNNENQKKIYLDLIGDGDLRSYIDELIKNNKYIKLLGFIPNYAIKNIYFNYDFLILPSSHENWGLVVNEAMESKLGILLSNNIGSKYDLLRNNVNGYEFNFTYKSLEGVFNKINNLNKFRINKFGINSFNIIKKYSIENSSREFIKFLRINSY